MLKVITLEDYIQELEKRDDISYIDTMPLTAEHKLFRQHSPFEPETIIKLFGAILETDSNIKFVTVPYAGIDEKVLVKISDMLKWTDIETIDFSQNLLTNTALPSILELVKTNHFLTRINLKNNDVYAVRDNTPSFNILKQIYLFCKINEKFGKQFEQSEFKDSTVESLYSQFFVNNAYTYFSNSGTTYQEINDFFGITPDIENIDKDILGDYQSHYYEQA